MTRIAFLALLTLIAFSPSSVADTFWVTHNSGFPDGSFWSALDEANRNPGEDTIRFLNSLNGQTIHWSSQYFSLSDTTGKTTIDASDLANGVILSAEQFNRVFDIDPDVEVELINLSLRDGKTYSSSSGRSPDGGAIKNEGVLTLRNCEFLDNGTGFSTDNSRSSGRGGAIFNSPDASLTAIDCVFTNNWTGPSDSTNLTNMVKTGEGGAIYGTEDVTLTRCTFTGNSTGNSIEYGRSGEGGAVYNKGGTLVVEDCVFDSNETGIGPINSGDGGAISSSGNGSTLEVLDSDFTGNQTGGVERSGNGGAIAHTDGMLVIERSDFMMNETGSFPPEALENGDSGAGGAIWIYNCPSVSISETSFANNRTGDGNGSGSGGAANLWQANATITQCHFTGNFTGGARSDEVNGTRQAGKGGAIYSGQVLTLSDSVFDNNRTGDVEQDPLDPDPVEGSGGGAIWNANWLSAKRCSFTNNRTGRGTDNSVPGGSGGAVENFLIASCFLENCTFSGNQTAPNATGGAIRWGTQTVGTALNCTIANNSAPGPGGEGGGIWGEFTGETINGFDHIKIDNSIIAGNTANAGPDVFETAPGTFTSLGSPARNLIGKNDGAASSFPAGPLVGTGASPVVADLAALADNGGIGLSHFPLAGGNVVNAGDNTLAQMPTDQLGFLRIVFSNVDLGAVEYAVTPDPPSGLSAAGAEPGVTLSWDAVADTEFYRIFRHGSDNPGAAVEIATTTSTGHVDMGATPGETHFYWVIAANAAFESDFSQVISAARPTLTVPTGLTATNTGGGVILSWNPTAHAESYRIYRYTTNQSFLAASIATPTETTHTNESIPGIVYHYWVKAIVGNFESDFSGPAIGKRLFPPVGNVTATDAFFDDRVRLTWDETPNAVEYVIFRNTSAEISGATEVGRVGAGGADFDDWTADPGTDYFYAIRPELSHGQEAAFSLWSEGRRSAAVTFRPDILIGKSPAAKLGDGIYNASGAGQLVKIRSKRRKALRLFFSVQADGAQADALNVRGTRGDRKFKVKYFGPGNVTAAVIVGNHIATLGPGEGAELSLVTKRKGRKTKRLGRKTFRTTGISGIVRERADTVVGKVWSG